MAVDQPIITTHVARSIINLVDYCYRLGINDAYDVGDEGLAREYLSVVSQVGVYGFLRDEMQTMDWNEWMLRLLAETHSSSWHGEMFRLYSLVGKRPNSSYLGAFVPVSQVFYAKGVKDYYDNPKACEIAVFRDKPRVLWTSRGLQGIKPPRYADAIQLACYDLARRDERVWAEAATKSEATKSGALIRRQYERFIRAVSLAISAKYDY